MSWLVLVLATTIFAGEKATPEPKPDPGIERATVLMGAAFQASERGDLLEAIDKWTEAYFTLPPDADHDGLRHELRLQLVTAHAQAHEADGDTHHLEIALDLLSASISDLPVEDVEGRAALAERRDEIAQHLEDAKAEQIAQFEQQQKNRSAYLGARVHRVWVPNDLGDYYTVGFGGAMLPPFKVLEILVADPLVDSQLRQKIIQRKKVIIRRKKVRISLAAIGGVALVTAGVLVGLSFDESIHRRGTTLLAGEVLGVVGVGGLVAAALLPSKQIGASELFDRVREYNQGLERRYGIDSQERIFPSAPASTQAKAQPRVELSFGPTPLRRGAGVSLRGSF